MRRAAALLPLLVVGCAAAPTGTETSAGAGPAEPCRVSDCFQAGNVRDFEIISDDTVVVFVGSQGCPFVVELQDDRCNVVFTPTLDFFQTALGRFDRLTPVQGGRVCATTRGLVVYSGIVSPSLQRLGELTETGIGAPRASGVGRADPMSFPVDPESVCRIQDVRSITDDQLIELYAESRTPPPPVGEGRLEVPEEPQEPEAPADAPAE